MFDDELKAKGWTPAGFDCFAKGDWSIAYDTSSWLIVSTRKNPRVFDVPVPSADQSAWTVHLIEHLCAMEDERQRLRGVLEAIRDAPEEAREVAIDALQQCYHKWLLNLDIPKEQQGREYCVICGALR